MTSQTNQVQPGFSSDSESKVVPACANSSYFSRLSPMVKQPKCKKSSDRQSAGDESLLWMKVNSDELGPGASSGHPSPCLALAKSLNPMPSRLPVSSPPSEEQLAELARQSQALETAQPWEILQWTAENFADGFAVATAFGAEGMLIIHWLSQVARQTPIFNLDTGYQFDETLQMVGRIEERYGLRVELVHPELDVQQYEQLHKGPVYAHNPDQCCGDRKMVPLKKRLTGVTAWASAIRRDQSPDRAKAPIVGWDRKFGLVKVSPLANWNKSQVWQTIIAEKVPYNPLHDQGYPSVGCKPCTRCVLAGDDERAGRWAGAKKTECGLHTWS